MINYQKDNFEGSLEDIMKSVNNILNDTGEGFETEEEQKESEMLKKRNLKNSRKEE